MGVGWRVDILPNLKDWDSHPFVQFTVVVITIHFQLVGFHQIVCLSFIPGLMGVGDATVRWRLPRKTKQLYHFLPPKSIQKRLKHGLYPKDKSLGGYGLKPKSLI